MAFKVSAMSKGCSKGYEISVKQRTIVPKVCQKDTLLNCASVEKPKKKTGGINESFKCCETVEKLTAADPGSNDPKCCVLDPTISLTTAR